MGLYLIAFLWGLAEATFFFIIPDMIITFIALHSFKAGLLACVITLVGALVGGVIMYQFAKTDRKKAYHFIANIPAVQEKMLDNVGDSIVNQGIYAMILGPMRGIPYKIYAVMAPGNHISLGKFILASIPARFVRFFLTSILASFLALMVAANLPMTWKYLIWLITWIIVYIIYFSIHPIKKSGR